MVFSNTMKISASLIPPGSLSIARAIAENNATFDMPSPAQFGRDGAGDVFVLNTTGGNLDVSSIAPECTVIGGRTINGAGINTITSLYDSETPSGQPWDTTPGTANKPGYSSALNVDPGNTGVNLSISEGTILKAISRNPALYESEGRGSIERYAALSVLTEKPSDGAIMGQPTTTAEADEFNVSDIDISWLPRLSTANLPSVPNIESLTDMMSNTRMFYTGNCDLGRMIHPTTPAADGLGYGGQKGYGDRTGDVLLAMMLDYTDEQLMGLAIQIYREAICLLRHVRVGGYWEPNGGLQNGRWPIMLMAAALTDNQEMATLVDYEGYVDPYRNRQRWHELGQHFYVDSADLRDKVELYEEGQFITENSAGYAVGDIVELSGGVSYDGTNTKFEITAVDGAGKVTGSNRIWQTFYHSRPTEVTNVTGSGTGLETNPTRNTRIYNRGMIGCPEWSAQDDSVAPRGGNNSHLYDAYRNNNLRATFGSVMAIRLASKTTMLMNAQAILDYYDRAFFHLGSQIPSIRLTDFHRAMWNEFRGWTDQAPGVPTVVEYGSEINVVWIKYNKLIYEETLDGEFPSKEDFSVSVNGSPVTIRELYIFADVVCLSILEAFAEGDAVAVSYTKGTAPNVVKDLFGNEADSFTDQATTNYTVDYVPAAPGSLVPDHDFNDQGTNYWGNFQIRYDAARDKYVARFDSGNQLRSDWFPVTGGVQLTTGFKVVDIEGGPTSRYILLTRDANGVEGAYEKLGGNTWKVLDLVDANDMILFTYTPPVDAVEMRIERIDKVFSTGSFTVLYFDTQPAG